MDKVFSPDKNPEQFQSPPTHQHFSRPVIRDRKMNRSPSERALQKFLQESAAASSPLSDTSSTQSPDTETAHHHHHPKHAHPNGSCIIQPPPPPAAATSSKIPIDSDDHQAFLQSRLDLACAAVALTKAPYVIAQIPATASDSASQASADSLAASPSPFKGSQDKDGRRPVGTPTLSANQNSKATFQSNPTGSGSSRDQSDDDEDAKGEDETTADNVEDPTDDPKRFRRMLSNRESARRSRRRKQTYLTELETQVAQLRVENSSLLKRLSDISHKYNEATVDNRVLKANVETLGAKVKMAHGSVKRAIGMNPVLQAMSYISTMSFPPSSETPSDTADAAVPLLDDPEQHHLQSTDAGYTNPSNSPRVASAAPGASAVENIHQAPANSVMGGNVITRTSSLPRVPSLEHLQKRIRGDTTRRIR